MNLLKLLLYGAIAYFIIRVIRHLMAGDAGKARPGRRRAPRTANMIRCAGCGMFITEGSALIVSDRPFCSRACAQVRSTRA